MLFKKVLFIGLISVLFLSSCCEIRSCDDMSSSYSNEFLTISLIEQDPSLLLVNEKSESKMFAAFKDEELRVSDNTKRAFEKEWSASYDKHDSLMSKIIHAYNFSKDSAKK